MIEAHTPTKRYDNTAVDDLSLTAARKGTVAALNEHGCIGAVASHLSLLRESLACDTGRDQHTYRNGRAERSHVLPRRRRPPRTAIAGGLTLAQWISRTASIR